MTVQIGNKVTLNYRGILDSGEEFDSSYSRNEPYTFEAGTGQVIAGFDNGVIGMEVGEKKTIKIAPTDGYGEIVEDKIQTVPKDRFPMGFEFKEGAFVAGEDQAGNKFSAKIISEALSDVTLDFNHPLAGQSLSFEVEVLEIN